MNCIIKRIAEHKSEIERMKTVQKSGSEEKVRTKMDQDDSGFDTSDSSDEKKRKQRLRCTIGGGSRTSGAQAVSKKQSERQH